MFVLTMKSSKKKLIIALVVAAVIAGSFLFINRNADKYYAVSPSRKYSLVAKDNAERLQFLSQFGWKTNAEPVEMCEIAIPETFNEVYKNYNSIQKEQGLDLLDYKGKICQRYTYEITNYPGKSAKVYADIFILDNKVIGGDVCSTELGGFMHGFENPNTQSEPENMSTSNKVNQNIPAEKSTERATLVPDPNMPNAPTD